MKKVYRLALVASLLGMFTVSCQKEEGEIHTSDRFKLEMAPFTDANGSKIYLQFGDEHSTLIYEEGDHIQVNGTVFTIHKQTDGWYANGTAISADKFYAAYVDGTLDNWNPSAHTYGFNINAYMENNQHNKVILAGTSDDGKVLTLQPACAIIRLNTGAAGRTWTDVKVGFSSNTVLKRGTLNPSDKTLAPGAYMDACAQNVQGDMLSMRWSKQGSSDYVGDEDGYWYVAVPIEGSSVSTTLFLTWNNGTDIIYYKTNSDVTLNKGYVYTLGTQRQSPFTEMGYTKSFFFKDASHHAIAFSAGNLQGMRYKVDLMTTRNVWQFASSQTTALKDDNAAIGLGVWVDLLGYGTSGNSAHPNQSSTSAGSYPSGNISGTDNEWGYFNYASPGINYGSVNITDIPWRTLTKDEWEYLIGRSGKAGLATLTLTNRTFMGLVLLPDQTATGSTWSIPDGVSFNAGFSSYTLNSFNAAQWTKLENSGAVFLPVTNYRNGTTIDGEDEGYYWTSTGGASGPGTPSYVLKISAGDVSVTTKSRTHGCAVRLVADASE